jgi:peptidoglycan/xylan/chitin deacetylase (PgdA/CDA1 family)
MGWLHGRGYQCITLGEFSRRMITGQGFPDRSVVLTFDDGYQSFYTEVFPILQEVGFPATVFLIPGFCGKDNQWPGQPSSIPKMNLLTWEQINEMARFGIEFGSHTSSHPRLDLLPDSALHDEVVLPKKILESRLGRGVTVFAYPYGRFTDQVKDLVSTYYEAACSTRLGLVTPVSDRYALERVEIKYISHPWVFHQLFNPTFPYYLSARSIGHAIRSIVLPNS